MVAVYETEDESIHWPDVARSRMLPPSSLSYEGIKISFHVLFKYFQYESSRGFKCREIYISCDGENE